MKILQPIFVPTLEMISKNFVDFQEHRMQFYTLIKGFTLEHRYSQDFKERPKPQGVYKLVIFRVSTIRTVIFLQEILFYSDTFPVAYFTLSYITFRVTYKR